MTLRHAVQTAIDDFDALDREMRRVLSEEGEIEAVMESGGYSGELAEIRERIRSLIEEIQGRLGRFRKDAAQLQERGGEDRKEQLVSDVHEMKSLLASLLATWERLNSLIEIVELSSSAGAASISSGLSKVRSVFSIMKNWIQRVIGQLWQVLSGLLRPKEWSLSGKVGTGFLGLADVQLEITFGGP